MEPCSCDRLVEIIQTTGMVIIAYLVISLIWTGLGWGPATDKFVGIIFDFILDYGKYPLGAAVLVGALWLLWS